MTKRFARIRKKLLCSALALSCLAGLCSCQDTKPADQTQQTAAASYSDTLGGSFLKTFDTCGKTDRKDIVSELIALEPDLSLMDMEVSPGYLDGFDGDITGFSTGTKFSPMIGSIPFVGYVFESEDPEGLLEELKEKANTAWNICTEADETVSGIKGSLVFFLMCSNEDQ